MKTAGGSRSGRAPPPYTYRAIVSERRACSRDAFPLPVPQLSVDVETAVRAVEGSRNSPQEVEKASGGEGYVLVCVGVRAVGTRLIFGLAPISPGAYTRPAARKRGIVGWGIAG